MSYIIAALIGGVALVAITSTPQQTDYTAPFMTGALVGVAVQLTLRLTKVS